MQCLTFMPVSFPDNECVLSSFFRDGRIAIEERRRKRSSYVGRTSRQEGCR